MKWFFQGTADFFGGFFQSSVIYEYRPDYHGPFDSFPLAKAAALDYYREIITHARDAQMEIRAIRESKAYARPRDPLELDQEHDQNPDRSPAR